LFIADSVRLVRNFTYSYITFRDVQFVVMGRKQLWGGGEAGEERGKGPVVTQNHFSHFSTLTYGPFKGLRLHFPYPSLFEQGFYPDRSSYIRDLSTPGLLIYPEDGGSTFLRNTGKHLPDYTASHTR
jgi:hypothetical protein